MKRIILNPNYVLKPDKGKTLMMSSLVGRNRQKGISDSFTNIIHPIYAMILSFMDGRDFETCIHEAAKELSVSDELIRGFTEKLIDNPLSVNIKNNNQVSSFPPNTIISVGKEECKKRYSADLFNYSEVDLTMDRHMTPSTITLMVNNVCATNCIYCYQDKSRIVNCTIPLKRIEEIIDEACNLNVNTFDVIGGEFFLYKNWKEVLKKLRSNGFNPYISTKIPLSREDIEYLSSIGIIDIQVSIDSAIEEHLISSLAIKKGYVNKMIESLRLLEEFQIPVMIHSVLTKYNDTIEDIQSVYNIISELSNLVDWHVVKGDPTLYPKTEYSSIEITPEAQNKIVDYLNDLNSLGKIKIKVPEKIISAQEISTDTEANNAVIYNKFFQRSLCSGLYSGLYILPNGDVTICEQLYWKKRFIIGNILKNSIEEIWNSEKAKSLFYIKQEDIPEDSQCHHCKVFKECRSVRQVCYREIIRKYGDDKWYYPDPMCPFSKTFQN